MPENTTIVKLANGSIEMLYSALTVPGWTSKRREVTAAGTLADILETFTEGRPVFTGTLVNNSPQDPQAFAEFRKTIKSWERAVQEITLTNVQFQACVACLTHFSDEKKLPANFAAANLLTEFKLSE